MRGDLIFTFSLRSRRLWSSSPPPVRPGYSGIQHGHSGWHNRGGISENSGRSLFWLITATALLRPNGITDLTASSVKKKMKSKGFARNVNREDIERGAAAFGVDLTEHIQFEIDALKPIAGELNLLRGAGEEG